MIEWDIRLSDAAGVPRELLELHAGRGLTKLVVAPRVNDSVYLKGWLISYTADM